MLRSRELVAVQSQRCLIITAVVKVGEEVPMDTNW